MPRVDAKRGKIVAALALGFGRVKSTCTGPNGCKENQEAARAWGCHEPAPKALVEIKCPACGGDGGDCECCEDTGVFRLTRCPRSVLADASDEVALVESLYLLEAGILPAEGGWSDQCGQWTSAVRLSSSYFQDCRQWKIEEASRKARAESAGKHGGTVGRGRKR